jgi:signal transduction histidine kinase
MDVAVEYGQDQRSTTTNDLTWRWSNRIGVAVAVGVAYFLAARLSLRLLLEPDGVAVFWPAAGISSGVLIALGPPARWSVAAGAMAGTIAGNLLGDRNFPAGVAFAVCNAVESLIAAGLIQHYFGANFTLGRLRQVLGLLAAAVIATAVSGVGGALGYKLFHSPTVPMLTTWRHWFASDAIGILAVAPVVIGVIAAVRKPPRWSEVVEGLAALGMLAALTGIVISLPEELWQTIFPPALLFPILLWLAAGFRPLFPAVGAFMVSFMVVWTTTFGIGHFGAAGLPIEDRILQAQAIIVVTTLGPLVLAALFQERRKAEGRLARAKMMLERERDNKLMNVEAITAAIAHEIRQPLASIAIDGDAALQLLEKTSRNYQKLRETLNGMMSAAHSAGEAFEGVRALFRQADEPGQSIDVNEVILGILGLLRGELRDRRVAERTQLASELPLVTGNRNQLQEVILNLIRNALEAMDDTPDRGRELRVRTAARGRDTVVIAVEDSGPGIDPKTMDRIFDAFFTTKSHGMGLGLAICRMIVERHGGQLTASSDGKSGALFSIILPTKPEDEVGAERE